MICIRALSGFTCCITRPKSQSSVFDHPKARVPQALNFGSWKKRIFWSTLATVRRIWASLLLAAFGFTLIGPAVFAFTADSTLPACCRSHGKHHCALPQSLGSSSGPVAVAGRCPMFEVSQTFPPQPTPGRVDLSQAIFRTVVNHPPPRPQTKALRNIAFDHTGQRRGPPFLA